MRTYTRQEQMQVAGEIQKLPPGDVLASWIEDYIALRDEVRACQRHR